VAAPAVAIAPPLASNAKPAPSEKPVETFQAPYPNRTELFIPPDLTHTTVAPSGVAGPSIAVRGFMNLDGQHVVLEIDGAVYVLEEGRKQGGVQVVSIEPPRVTLERRGERWSVQMVRPK
jgi:hypothetical protein